MSAKVQGHKNAQKWVQNMNLEGICEQGELNIVLSMSKGSMVESWGEGKPIFYLWSGVPALTLFLSGGLLAEHQHRMVLLYGNHQMCDRHPSKHKFVKSKPRFSAN